MTKSLGDAFSPHSFPVFCRRLGDRTTDIVTYGKCHIKILIWILMVKKVVAGTKFIQRPIRKKSVRGLVHLKMNLIPNRMVDTYNEHEHASPYWRKKEQYDRDGQAFDEALPKIQANTSIFSLWHRIIMEHLAVLGMVLNGMARKNLLTQPQIFEERSPRLFVHEPTMNLMLDKRHQNNHRRKPAS